MQGATTKEKEEVKEKNELEKVIDLAKKLLVSGNASVTKRRRMEWLKKHSSSSSSTLTSANNNTNTKSSISSWSTKSFMKSNEDGKDDEDDIEEDENLMFLKISKKHRVRSRNAWVDQYMQEDKEQESYADLEGFLADMNEDLT